ncbi:MAG: hypothetical protein ACRD9R_08915 [Pyrinomonadaceae bacterium]
MNTQTQTLNNQQQSIVAELQRKFDLDPEQVLFLNPNRPDEPWLSAEALMSVARQSGGFQSTIVNFDQHVAGLNQVIHVATVIDKEGRTYSRSGVATVGEKLPDGGSAGEHGLAASRALGSALRAAGFDPFKAGSVVQIDLKRNSDSTPATGRELIAAEVMRSKNLSTIHILAEQKGLIRNGPGGRREMAVYRSWLLENFGADTAALLNEREFLQAINALRQMPEPLNTTA